MAKIKYNVKGVETGGGPLPKAGIYRCKVTSCVDGKPADKGRRLEVVYEIQSDSSGDKTHKGHKLYDYIPLERDDMDWKVAQFIRAMGMPDVGDFDPKETVGTALNVRVRIQPESEEYAAKATPATLIPLDGEEDSDGENLEEETDGEEGGEDEAWTEEELEALEKAELKEVAGEFEVAWPRRLTDAGKAKVIAAILEAQGAAEESEDGDDEDAVDGEADELWTEEELTELDDETLKGVAFGDPDDENDEGFELDESDYVTKKKNPKTKKMVTKFDRDGLIAAILEAQGDGEEEAADGEEGEEPPDYNSMELAALKTLCKERKLDAKGTKKMLVARLTKDDEPF